MEADVTLPQDKVKEVTEIAVTHINAAVCELRRLFLVEDLVDSIKFGVLLWCLTYVGAWFNGMTIIIIGTLRYHYVIDSNSLALAIVHAQQYQVIFNIQCPAD